MSADSVDVRRKWESIANSESFIQFVEADPKHASVVVQHYILRLQAHIQGIHVSLPACLDPREFIYPAIVKECLSKHAEIAETALRPQNVTTQTSATQTSEKLLYDSMMAFHKIAHPTYFYEALIHVFVRKLQLDLNFTRPEETLTVINDMPIQHGYVVIIPSLTLQNQPVGRASVFAWEQPQLPTEHLQTIATAVTTTTPTAIVLDGPLPQFSLGDTQFALFVLIWYLSRFTERFIKGQSNNPFFDFLQQSSRRFKIDHSEAWKSHKTVVWIGSAPPADVPHDTTVIHLPLNTHIPPLVTSFWRVPYAYLHNSFKRNIQELDDGIFFIRDNKKYRLT